MSSRTGGWPPRAVVGRSSGLRSLERALYRRGLGPVAGVDEAGRGACAGPLVVAACVLGDRAHGALAGLDDSKRLTAAARERLYPVIRSRAAAYSIVFVGPREVDRSGVHAANLEGMRRAVSLLGRPPGYVLTDGFRVAGMPASSLAVIGGDAAAACIAAASVLAKVARDGAMIELDGRYPDYGFAAHKGYTTAAHRAALAAWGPCAEHRMSYANVAAAARARGPGYAAGPLRARRR